MNLLKVLKNQKGVSTLLVVMAVGGILATFILTLQLYVHSRARIVARIRLAYKYTFVMEDAAKLIVLGRTEYLQDPTCNGGAKDVKWIANGTAPANPTANINICLPAGAAKCINNEACICSGTGGSYDTNVQCANHQTSLDKKFLPKNMISEDGDAIVAIESRDKDKDLWPAFERSIFEKLIPHFDEKFVAFVDKVIKRKSSKNSVFLNEAVAAANIGYTYTLAATNMYGSGAGAVPANNSPPRGPQSPYPDAATKGNQGDAYNFRSCGNNRCVDLRVCVTAANEPALAAGEVCFVQKISRSFLWDHALGPCAASACAAPADYDNPANGTKGNSSCADCPWRERF